MTSQVQRLDNYMLSKTLGKGFSAEVKLAVDPRGDEFAIKMFDLENPSFSKRAFRLLKEEVHATTSLDNKHIVKYLDFKEEATVVQKNGSTKRVAYIVQELVQGGELFDYISNSGAVSESICKFYFKQLVSGLYHMYSKGFSHRDLKPENILVDSAMDLKIVDFGFATPLEARDGTGFSKSMVGTVGYMSPEIIAKQPYQGYVADIFSLGVILFVLYAGHPPFDKASNSDRYYTWIHNNRTEVFWQKHEKHHPAGFFSSSFKEIISCMLQAQPVRRPGFADIIGSDWLAEGVATAEEAHADFARRAQNTKQVQQQAKNSGSGVYRNSEIGGAREHTCKMLTEELPKYGFYVNNNEPEAVFQAIQDKLQNEGCSVNSTSKAFTLDVEVTQRSTPSSDDEINDGSDEKDDAVLEADITTGTNLQIRLRENENFDLFVEFKRKGGDALLFNDQMTKISELFN